MPLALVLTAKTVSLTSGLFRAFFILNLHRTQPSTEAVFETSMNTPMSTLMTTSTTVYFSHGKESGPWGIKITYLAKIAKAHGLAVKSIDYRETLDPDKRVEKLKAILEQETSNVILAGSSMGGYVSAVTANDIKVDGLFLIAPALYFKNWGVAEFTPKTDYSYVIHGWDDDIVPVESAQKFSKTNKATMQLLDGGHTLNDQLPAMRDFFQQFLNHCAPVESDQTA